MKMGQTLTFLSRAIKYMFLSEKREDFCIRTAFFGIYLRSILPTLLCKRKLFHCTAIGAKDAI